MPGRDVLEKGQGISYKVPRLHQAANFFLFPEPDLITEDLKPREAVLFWEGRLF